MATCIDVIKDALIWRGALDEEEDPTPRQAASGLLALKGVYQEIINGTALTPITVSAAYTAGENQRISNISGTADVITLPETITVPGGITLPDGTTAMVRPPLDRSVIVIAGQVVQNFIYDAPIGDWIDIELLKLADPAPLSVTFGEGLSARLSVALRYPGVPVDPVAASAAATFRSRMAGHWDVERSPTQAAYF